MDEDPSDVGQNLGYNPDQDVGEKREIRMKLRTLMAEQKERRANVANTSATEIVNNLKQQDDMFRNVKSPEEALVDSKILRITSDMSAAKVRALKHDAGGFDVDEFIVKLVTFMGGRRAEDHVDEDDLEENLMTPLQWHKIGRKALAKSRRVAGLDIMLGPLRIEQKKRAQGKRLVLKKKKEDERKPQELTADDIENTENETTKNVRMIDEILMTQSPDEPLNFFKLIINPHDFGQSVENLFYLSFLVRDCKACVELKEDHELVVYATEPPEETDYQAGAKKRQIITELDMSVWKKAIEVFNITEPMIKTRTKPVEYVANGRWFT